MTAAMSQAATRVNQPMAAPISSADPARSPHRPACTISGIRSPVGWFGRRWHGLPGAAGPKTIVPSDWSPMDWSPMSDVAVVIATRNRSTELDRTLTELAALPERPLVVVADNGSSDGTAAVTASHPGVKLLSLGQNLGCGARTAGARTVSTPYVAFSDDDSWWAPGALSMAAGLLDRHPRLGLVAARILVGPEEREDPVCTAMAASPLPGAGLPGPAVLGFVACGAVVRREAFLGVGGFEARFGIGGEEELLALDLAAAGWGLTYAE